MDATWFQDPGPDDCGYQGRCNARKRVGAPTAGERCRAKAGWRTTHEGVGPCIFHGGASPNVTKKYQKLQAGALLHGYGLLRDGDCDPRDLLMEELQRTAGNIDYLTLVLGDLSEEELLGVVPLPAELKTGSSEKDGDHHELLERFGLPALVSLYQWERSHLAKLSAEAVKLGLLERAVRVEEAQATLVAAALGRALEELGLPWEQLEQIKMKLRDDLLSIEAKPPPALKA